MEPSMIQFGGVIVVAVTMVDLMKHMVLKLIDRANGRPNGGYSWLDRKYIQDQFDETRGLMKQSVTELEQIRKLLERERV